MSCAKHGWIPASDCPNCQTEAANLEQHRTVFVECAAIALWIGQDPTGIKSESALDQIAKGCWLEASRLWKARVL